MMEIFDRCKNTIVYLEKTMPKISPRNGDQEQIKENLRHDWRTESSLENTEMQRKLQDGDTHDDDHYNIEESGDTYGIRDNLYNAEVSEDISLIKEMEDSLSDACESGKDLQNSQHINSAAEVEEQNVISFQILSEYEPDKIERPFKCDLCGSSFGRRDHLRRHEARHTGERNKKCEICFKIYSNLTNLRQHLRTIHNGETPYECDICLRKFTTKSSLTYHTRALHSSETIIYTCALCNKTFFSAAQVRRHSLSHKGRDHTCTICGLAFSKRSAMKSHKIALHRPFIGQTSYHMSADTIKMEIIWDNENEFTDSLGVDRVIKEEKIDYHSLGCDDYGSLNTESEIDIDKCQVIETSFNNSTQCIVCGKILTSQHSYMMHMRIHNGDMPYKCDMCPKSFSLARILKTHKTAHGKGQLKIECDICGKRLAHSNALQDHMRLHTGERPFKCDMCPGAFTTKSYLKYHMNSQHTGERNYTCIKCEKSFLTKSHLQQHNLSHNKVKGIICEVCGTVFLNRNYVVQHKINVHNINANNLNHQDRENEDLKRTSTCGICGKILSINTIRRHILVKHSDRVKCECNNCGSNFKTVDDLVEHQKTDCLKSVEIKKEYEEMEPILPIKSEVDDL